MASNLRSARSCSRCACRLLLVMGLSQPGRALMRRTDDSLGARQSKCRRPANGAHGVFFGFSFTSKSPKGDDPLQTEHFSRYNVTMCASCQTED